MAYALKDRLFVSILLNGLEFPLDQANVLDYLHIGSSVRQSVPTVSFSVTDVSKFLTLNNLLVDGTLISVVLGKDDRRTTYNFRLFSFKETPSSTPKYQVRGYLDSPLYWSSSLVEIQRGTTDQVLKSLAKKCGLTYEGTPTSDSQVWIPHNLPIREFARYLAERGWADNSSCMAIGLSPTKVLRYRNVALFESLPIKGMFSTGKLADQVLPILDHKVTTRSGFFNTSSGYQDTVVTQSIFEDDSDLSAVTFKKNSARLMLNTAIKESITQNRVSYAPVSVGNTHANFERALYQNRRLSNMFTLGFDFMTSLPTDADLLDVVNIDIELPDVKGSRKYSGKYLVTSKVFYVQGANYFEKFELARHGLNETRETTQT